MNITSAQGVSVVYDAIGKDVFVSSLGCLATRGMAINYGPALGDVEAFYQSFRARGLRFSIGLRFKLGDVREAHLQLEGRFTTGSVVIDP
jgi:NADPH:quinone reductase